MVLSVSHLPLAKNMKTFYYDGIQKVVWRNVYENFLL